MPLSPTVIADKLLAEGAISKSQHSGALKHYGSYGGFIEEALLDTGVVDEDTLLKVMAQHYKTRFVTTAKLKKADIGQHVLSKLPADFVKRHMVFPILWDEKSNILSIVAVDPSDLGVEQEIIRIARVSKIRAFVARPGAIKAAIQKFYKGDIHAFASVDKESIKAFQSMMDVYERNLLDEGDMAAAVASSMSQNRERTISADEISKRDARVDDTGRFSVVETTSMPLELVRVLISLIESERKDLSGHSTLTANYTEQICTRIGLGKWEVGNITLASLIHDLGKGEPYHLTAFNVSEWDGHTATAKKRFETPLRLLESAKLPLEASRVVRHMYERVDGNGFPEGLKGAEVPLGSRVLAITDTFADLTSNPRNPYRRILTTAEAMEVLQKAAGTVFDPNLVELFGTVVAGDDIKRKLLTGARSVLVVDSDAEQCAILEMQLMTRGFKVRSAKTSDAALKLLLQEPVNLVLSEVELKPFTGFELKKRLNEHDSTKSIPFFFFTARAASADVEKGFELGAQDYLVKPSTINVVAAKIQKHLDRDGAAVSQGGVSGSLKEMSLPDLVQILSHGRKTGQLKVVSGKHRGEIHFVEGEIYNALMDTLRGEEAFFAMLRFKEGTFALDPSFTADSRVIGMTAEMLLLEGLRRFDEDNR